MSDDACFDEEALDARLEDRLGQEAIHAGLERPLPELLLLVRGQTTDERLRKARTLLGDEPADVPCCLVPIAHGH